MIDEGLRDELIQVALTARDRAYAPQSNFYVGAAAATKNGGLYPGVNVENSSYGLTCCAERVALFSAIAAGDTEFVALAIASDGGHAPCGACRQVIVELAPDATLFLVDSAADQQFHETNISELLPKSFKLPPRSTE